VPNSKPADAGGKLFQLSKVYGVKTHNSIDGQQTVTQQCDLISVILFFQNTEIMLKMQLII
jgi:hypothetical protein